MSQKAISITRISPTSFRIEGRTKGMTEAEMIKKTLDPVFETEPDQVSLIFTDTDVLASYLLGYLLNRKLEGEKIIIYAGNPKLIELTRHLNIDKALNITPYQE